MARLARLVIPGIAHHVTHRGNRRGDIFLDRTDWDVYRLVLERFLPAAGCRLWGYCWMTNHVHLLVVREAEMIRAELAAIDALPAALLRKAFNLAGRESGVA